MESYTSNQVADVAMQLYSYAEPILKNKKKYSGERILLAKEYMRHAALLNEFAIEKLVRGDPKSLSQLHYSFQDSVGATAEWAARCWMYSGCADSAVKVAEKFMHPSQQYFVKHKLERTYNEARALRKFHNEMKARFNLF